MQTKVGLLTTLWANRRRGSCRSVDAEGRTLIHPVLHRHGIPHDRALRPRASHRASRVRESVGASSCWSTDCPAHSEPGAGQFRPVTMRPACRLGSSTHLRGTPRPRRTPSSAATRNVLAYSTFALANGPLPAASVAATRTRRPAFAGDLQTTRRTEGPTCATVRHVAPRHLPCTM